MTPKSRREPVWKNVEDYQSGFYIYDKDWRILAEYGESWLGGKPVGAP